MSRTTRAAAVTTLVLALAYLVQVPRIWQVAEYLGVLMVAGVAAAGIASFRLWTVGAWDGRMLAATVAALSLTGHLLNLTVGLPGATALRGGISALSASAALAALATLVLVVRDARRTSPTRPESPYAV